MNVREALVAVVQAYNSTLTAYGSMHVTTAASHSLRRAIDNAIMALAKPDIPPPVIVVDNNRDPVNVELDMLRERKAWCERVHELKFPKEVKDGATN